MEESPCTPAVAVEPRVERLRFSGTGAEYFRIWIVNLALTILTLGIYSAWAKVRKQRWFYGHTHFAGSTFEYHANPVAILKGRVIAAALFVLYVVASESDPVFLLVVVALYFAIAPWIVMMALRFRARVSSWRGIRFGFHGRLGEAYAVFCLLALAVPLSLGTLLPLWWQRRQRYAIGHLRFGTTPFRFGANAGSYYRVFLVLLAIAVSMAVVVLVCVSAFYIFLTDPSLSDPDAPPTWGESAMGYAVALTIGSVLNGFARGMIGNLALGATRVGPHRLRASYEPWTLAWIQLSNTALVVATLGICTPWAQVRLQRHLIDRTAVVVDGDLDSFVAEQAGAVGATGGEMAEFFDIDLGF